MFSHHIPGHQVLARERTIWFHCLEIQASSWWWGILNIEILSFLLNFSVLCYENTINSFNSSSLLSIHIQYIYFSFLNVIILFLYFFFILGSCSLDKSWYKGDCWVRPWNSGTIMLCFCFSLLFWVFFFKVSKCIGYYFYTEFYVILFYLFQIFMQFDFNW